LMVRGKRGEKPMPRAERPRSLHLTGVTMTAGRLTAAVTASVLILAGLVGYAMTRGGSQSPRLAASPIPAQPSIPPSHGSADTSQQGAFFAPITLPRPSPADIGIGAGSTGAPFIG